MSNYLGQLVFWDINTFLFSKSAFLKYFQVMLNLDVTLGISGGIFYLPQNLIRPCRRLAKQIFAYFCVLTSY